jgi:hypothetical protein
MTDAMPNRDPDSGPSVSSSTASSEEGECFFFIGNDVAIARKRGNAHLFGGVPPVRRRQRRLALHEGVGKTGKCNWRLLASSS